MPTDNPARCNILQLIQWAEAIDAQPVDSPSRRGWHEQGMHAVYAIMANYGAAMTPDQAFHMGAAYGYANAGGDASSFADELRESLEV